jgi:hypothetical protein
VWIEAVASKPGLIAAVLVGLERWDVPEPSVRELADECRGEGRTRLRSDAELREHLGWVADEGDVSHRECLYLDLLDDRPPSSAPLGFPELEQHASKEALYEGAVLVEQKGVPGDPAIEVVEVD